MMPRDALPEDIRPSIALMARRGPHDERPWSCPSWTARRRIVNRRSRLLLASSTDRTSASASLRAVRTAPLVIVFLSVWQFESHFHFAAASPVSLSFGAKPG